MKQSRPARALMLQGTGSDVGKSLLVAGLCRVAARRGIRVAPFKPQNMSNNAAVCPGGGEIGRAQALQARAARLEPHVDMNPVLLKPESDQRAQVVVHGQALGSASATNYQARRGELRTAVFDSFHRLCSAYELVLVEGAGSPAEINLRQGDLANMGFAVPQGVPVILVGDIDRGGVIAALVGTFELLTPDERALVRGTLINKFRGDVKLFEGGLRAIEARTGWPGFGVLPFLPTAARLPAEDGVALERTRPRGAGVCVAVPMLSRIANFDDFDPLALEPGVELRMVPPGQPLPAEARLVILPGTKATLADLAFLRAQGWDIDLLGHVRRGGAVLGLCGGYQLLGRRIQDPHGIEGEPGEAEGLGLLDVETVLEPAKTLVNVAGTELSTGQAVSGFEMHVGRTAGADTTRPMLRLSPGRAEGACSPSGLIKGSYVHGLFASDAFRRSFLGGLGVEAHQVSYEAEVEGALDLIAARMEEHLDVDGLLQCASPPLG